MEPKHSPADVFASYDEFFSPSNLLKYVEVSPLNPSSISDFGQFYTDVYMEAFPDDDEREGFDNLLKYLKRSTGAKDYKHHIVLAKDESDHIIGGCIFNYYRKSNSGVIEFLAVKSDMQSSGVGTMIYKHVTSILSEDAHQMCGKPLDYICCEIDSPEHSRAEIKKYLYFWNKNNFWHIDFDYVQPALSVEQKAVTGLWFTISPQRNSHEDVPAQLVADVLYDYIKYAMSIEEPENCKEYQEMKAQILKKDKVDLREII